MSTPSLDNLARAHGTDKSSYRNHLATTYERYVSHLRHHRVRVLEIGVYEGASLRMWRDYFPAGEIVGIDIREDAVDHRGERISIHVGDQADREFIEQVAHTDGPFDLIVDDGSHRVEHQLPSLLALWPHLRPDGWYAVEDIQTAYLPRWADGWRTPGTIVETLKDVVDDIHSYAHNQPVTLTDLDEVHFFRELCLLRRTGNWAPQPYREMPSSGILE